jgi:hypothetical protein
MSTVNARTMRLLGGRDVMTPDDISSPIDNCAREIDVEAGEVRRGESITGREVVEDVDVTEAAVPDAVAGSTPLLIPRTAPLLVDSGNATDLMVDETSSDWDVSDRLEV